MSSRHPSTLLPICLIEAAERLAASLLGALLVFHLTDEQRLRPGLATEVQAVFLGCSYGLGILGGLTADRLIGYRRALAIGLLLLGAGYSLLSLEGRVALGGGLVVLVLGHALFKPTVTAVLGGLYQNQPEQRAAGFAWFYITINIAALIAPWAGALLQKRVGWTGAIVAAAWSVAIGLLVLLRAVTKLPEPLAVLPGRKQESKAASFPKASCTPWSRLARYLLAMLLFSAAYGQAQGTLLLFARARLVRTIGGYELPAEAFAALPALLVLIVKPMLDVLRRVGSRWSYALRGPAQLAAGLLLTTGAFLLLASATWLYPLAKLSPAWLLGAETLLTTAELLVLPEAMALVSELSPARQGALSQGLLLGTQALGLFAAGLVGSLWGRMPEAWFFATVAVGPLSASGIVWRSRLART